MWRRKRRRRRKGAERGSGGTERDTQAAKLHEEATGDGGSCGTSGGRTRREITGAEVEGGFSVRKGRKGGGTLRGLSVEPTVSLLS